MKKSKVLPQTQTQIQHNKRLGAIIERILELHGKTREAVAEYCKAAIEEGFTGIETWNYLYSRLKETVAKSTLFDWGNKYLPEGSMKVTKPKNGSTKIPVPESFKSERSLPQNQLEQKEQGVPGRYNQAPEDFRPEEAQKYDIDYLREVALCFYEKTVELMKQKNKGLERSNTKHMEVAQVIERLKEQNKILKEENARLKAAASTPSSSSSTKTVTKLRPYEPPTEKMALDSWEVVRWMDDKMGHCGTCQKIGEADPNRKQDQNRMFEHYYKRYRKGGYIQEVVRVDDNGKVDVYHIVLGAYSLTGIPPTKLETTELKPRQNYWKTHLAPMNKIEEARKRAKEWKKAQEEYEEKKSKLTPEERKALADYETKQLMSGFKSLMKS